MRDRNRLPYEIVESEVFEAAYKKLVQRYPGIVDQLENLFWTLCRKPQNEGRFCRAYDNNPGEFRITTTPPTVDTPPFRILFQVGTRQVKLWHLSEAEFAVI